MEPRTFSSTLELPQQPLTMVKNLMVYLGHAVFPAPDSPLMLRGWFFPNLLLRDRGGHTTSQRDLRHSPLPPQGILFPHHLPGGILCQGRDVGVRGPQLTAAVGVNHLLLMDGQQLGGVG